MVSELARCERGLENRWYCERYGLRVHPLTAIHMHVENGISLYLRRLCFAAILERLERVCWVRTNRAYH